MVTTPTLLVQSRSTAIVNGDPVYLVNNLLQTAGQLPDVGVFLLEIVDTTDASTDTLKRVVKPPDFAAYTSRRQDAIANGQRYYRNSAWQQAYADLQVATAAALNFKDRINQLLKDWMQYYYQFSYGPPGEAIYLPTPDKAQLLKLIGAYQATAAALETATAAKADADQAAAAAQAAASAAETYEQALDDLLDSLTAAKAQSDALNTFIGQVATVCTNLGTEPVTFPQTTGSGSGFWGALNDLIYTIDNTGSVPGAVTAARNTFVNSAGVPVLESIKSALCGTALPAARTAYADLTAQLAAATAAHAAAEATLTAANAALQAALKTQVKRAAEQAQASSDVAAALAAVRAACPDFDPANPSASTVN